MLNSYIKKYDYFNVSKIMQNYQKGFNESVVDITEPRIYFGLETNNTIVTNSKNKNEFDGFEIKIIHKI